MVQGTHRPTHCTISFPALRHNLETIKRRLPENTKISAVIKADAYGHGAVPVAEYLEKDDAIYMFNVAISDEALELRQAGIVKPILILGHTAVEDAWLHAAESITVTISSVEWLKQALDIKPAGVPALPIFLKIDSGMGRIGVRNAADGQEIIDFIAEHEDSFRLEGIFTHQSTADGDSTMEVDHTEMQTSRFTEIIDQLDFSQLSKRPIISQSNSAMAIWHPEQSLDMIRLGCALYGINPSNGAHTLPEDVDLKQVMCWETELVWVKQMEQEDTIGYGATYTSEPGEWIGTIPVGYADGFNRKLSGFEVLIDGERCPIIGRVCMDQCMVRLPKELSIGTTVTLLGQNNDAFNSINTMSIPLETIDYEVVCAISKRVPRQYAY